MGHDRDKKPDAGNYHFIKETIKKKPLDKKTFVCRIAAIIGGGLLFGFCAAAAFAAAVPAFVEHFGLFQKEQEDVSLVTPEAQITDVLQPTNMAQPTDAAQPSPSAKPTASPKPGDSNTKLSAQTALEEYEGIYSEVLRASKEPRKALVTVSGLTEDADLLDDSFVSCGKAEGIIFLDNGSNFYILINGEGLEEANRLQVTFSDGSTAAGNLCKTDKWTGLAVVRVPAVRITAKTLKAISVASLGTSYSLLQAKPVIAIGSPAGDHDAVVYGMVTSVSGRLSVADAEYNLLATDMQGSPGGSGVLLDTTGNVIGFIVKEKEGETNIIRALAISQLRPLLELLSNGDPIKYLGIRGISVTDAKADVLGIPKGIYVDSVETDSPAMVAGIQNGDIITFLDGNAIKNMQSYTTRLQKLEIGQHVKIILSRKSSEGEYVDMNFEVTIEER